MHKRGIHRRTRKQFVTASTVFDLFNRGMVKQEPSQRGRMHAVVIQFKFAEAGQSDPVDHRIEIVRGHAFLSIKVARFEGESSNELGIEHEECGGSPRRIRWDRHEVNRKQDGRCLNPVLQLFAGPVTRLAIEAMMEHKMQGTRGNVASLRGSAYQGPGEQHSAESCRPTVAGPSQCIPSRKSMSMLSPGKGGKKDAWQPGSIFVDAQRRGSNAKKAILHFDDFGCGGRTLDCVTRSGCTVHHTRQSFNNQIYPCNE
ncbi:hypothetical protein DFH06DRAFT_1418339 [Mycena polygramma]|nr:hypothetical protein DFH06DRAFT_1418339 [Mycena polygramma]